MTADLRSIIRIGHRRDQGAAIVLDHGVGADVPIASDGSLCEHSTDARDHKTHPGQVGWLLEGIGTRAVIGGVADQRHRRSTLTRTAHRMHGHPLNAESRRKESIVCRP
ncbi:hypothetical protein GCM10009813_14360 [Brevibacterium marinum]